ncbi:methylmalonyl-CoA mutase subunit beta [Micromonospora sp. NBC_01699]|uniref:methylmalonyl-CoA mutase family protein n=1 Tax=Micromonospora sp. NBC_01699 TaxID=2975984 RepID=UPI002E2A0EE3|nr:methylmalonyl-CoA mutase family protein [Micromonospora sp. NBC_01699]
MLTVLRKSGAADESTSPAAAEELLARMTYDGIHVAPLYTAADAVVSAGLPGLSPFTRGGRSVGSGWDVRQRHVDPDPVVTNEAILADLENGGTSVWLVLGSGGVDPAALPVVLDGVFLDMVGVVLDAGPLTEVAAAALFGLADGVGVAPGQLSGSLGVDPLGWQARTGEVADLRPAAALAVRCAAEYPGLRAVTIDATVFHDAGGSDAQELGCSIAAGVAYLRALTGAGLDPAAALGLVEFRYAVGADQFLGVAKLRAARRLWGRVAQVCGVGGVGGQRQHAVTSAAMMTARDPWVNMLRTTLACFAAGVGGADAVTVAPFDARLGLPDGFSRRIARNTQSLLLAEANVGRVIDPAGGSWYVERLTEDLAQAAWVWFTEIERAGGLSAALSSGLVGDRLAGTWGRRVENLAHRRDPITGVSEFPNLEERRPVRPPAPTSPGGGLPRHRYAEVFEDLRDRAETHIATTGIAPTVFLATLGPVAAHTARASFAANLFAAGGITTVRGGPGTDPDGIVAAFVASGATVACVCGTDKAYTTLASPVAAALTAVGAVRIWLAGPPGGYDGVDSYLFTGCDAVRVLQTTLADLEVA